MEACYISFRYFAQKCAPWKLKLIWVRKAWLVQLYSIFRNVIIFCNVNILKSKQNSSAEQRLGEDFAITEDPYFCTMEGENDIYFFFSLNR
ncbi:hypothetical protein CEXT_387731 [Caerostris extrusa]|uniref:Uncharacterized protein n=1 Tax=Caerostris extrusa TaxID=172846 RepID=A0AAV4Q8U1_CAEEX|nr:hypothetical protein CEXT_387731 [Caerostris extrusa]